MAEFWDGWFDHWGEEHHVRDTETVANILKQILDSGASFNLYMFHGVLIVKLIFSFLWNFDKKNSFVNIKVAEHSFQVPMPNSPLLLNYL